MPLDILAVKMKVAELADALEKSLPGYAALLKVIHEEMRLQPELTYRLDDTEIALVISGLEKWNKVEVQDVREKKAEKVNKKQGSLLSEDDV